MSADNSDRDLKALWQDQTPETDPMTLDHIRAISRRLDRQTQLALVVGVLSVAFGFFVFGQQWQRTEDLLTRVTFALYGFGIAGCAWLTYRIMYLRRDPAEPGGVFLRRRLERYLQMARGRHLVILLPLAPAMVSVTVLAGRNMARLPHPHPVGGVALALRMAPLVVLAAAWLVTLMVVQPRRVDRLKRDLDELNALMK